jgi:flagellar hook-associated protein 2
MAGTSVDGLVSGMSTSSLIQQLLQLERQPQVRLQGRRDAVNRDITNLLGVNTRVAGLQDAAKKLTEPTAWRPVTATSSDTSAVSVTASPGAPTGNLSFTVNRLARAHALVGTDVVADPADTTTYDPQGGPFEVNGKAITGMKDGSLAEMVRAINATADLGVRATAVRVGTEGYRLQLTATATGEASQFTTSGLGGFDVLSQGQDAELVIGETNPYTVRSATNAVTGVLDGVTLNLRNAQPGTRITVEVSADAGAVATSVQRMVDALNAVFEENRRLTAFNPDTKRGGPLQGSSLLRSMTSELLSATSSPVTGADLGSAGAAGISLTREGTVTFDRQAFLDAYAKDPAAVGRLFYSDDPAAPGVAQRLEAVARSMTAPSTGALTTAVQSRRDQARGLEDRITEWDARIALKEKALKRQFTGLESALGKMNAQSSWLAGQIGSLPKMRTD